MCSAKFDGPSGPYETHGEGSSPSEPEKKLSGQPQGAQNPPLDRSTPPVGTVAFYIDGGEDQIRKKSTEELLNLMSVILEELKGRINKETQKVAVVNQEVSFPDLNETDVKEFIRLPEATEKAAGEISKTSWRILLISARLEDPPLALEIYDDVTIGRTSKGEKIDLDLTDFAAEESGVSRKHAMFRATEDKLLLIDLGSVNGTFCNAIRAKLGHPLEVSHNDTIALGKLHFNVKIIGKPGQG